ncbi:MULTISPECIES: YueI family protein [Furfurilactobacillus]|uniref:DUF1694 domain-containing protein n=1 Tax=Furfurilactobacillus rossiae TaxID=231049 RepID=A0A7C9IZR0_9LACO|nr:YueI family protein [Furfurilactobacillus milii]MYV04477.1 DUF1694 domain-containing protein [Furfurilactobacillus milii]
MADNHGTDGDTNQRLSNAIYGTPKINPDEQRHYLGTFRERVALTMTVAQLRSGDYLTAFGNDLSQRDEVNNTVLMNGNLGQDVLGPYIRTTTMHAVSFTIKNDPEYKIGDDDLALVVTAKTAIDVNPVDIAKKYADQTSSNSDQPKPVKKTSFWQRLFNK